MTGLLEVVVLHAADAERAEAGGADRLELTSSLTDGLSPEPALMGQVRRAPGLYNRWRRGGQAQGIA
jgi:copper homeostasis protein